MIRRIITHAKRALCFTLGHAWPKEGPNISTSLADHWYCERCDMLYRSVWSGHPPKRGGGW